MGIVVHYIGNPANSKPKHRTGQHNENEQELLLGYGGII